MQDRNRDIENGHVGEGGGGESGTNWEIRIDIYTLVWVCSVASVMSNTCNPMDCSPPGYSVYGILQARRLEWVAISLSRGSSRPRDRTQVSGIAGRFFTAEPLGKPDIYTLPCVK